MTNWLDDSESTAKIKQFKLEEIRNTPIKRFIGESLEFHNAVIFYALDDPTGAGGSGILAHYNGIKGILTASHVVAPFKDKKKIFLPCFLRPKTSDIWDIDGVPFIKILTMDDLNLYLKLGKNWSENGLDIAFVQIEDNIFENIVRKWNKKALNLAEMRKKYFSQEVEYWAPENKHNWIWTIVGTPREGCKLIQKDINYFPHGSTFVGGGQTKLRNNTLQKVCSPFKGINVDIIEFPLGPTKDILPRDFSGASGGGIYQIRVDDQFEIRDVLLSGVFVAGNENTGTLYGRGHVALYDIFCKFLDDYITGDIDIS